MAAIVVDSCFDKQTYTDYFWYDNLHSISKTWAIWAAEGFAVAFAVLQTVTGGFWYILAGWALVVFAPVLWLAVLRLRLRRYLRVSGLAENPLPVQYTIGSRQIASLNKKTGKHLTVRWLDVVKVKETKAYFFLYIDGSHAMVIRKAHVPKDALAEIAGWAAKSREEREYGKVVNTPLR